VGLRRENFFQFYKKGGERHEYEYSHDLRKEISREELALIPTPEATRSHQPVPHHEIVQALIETLSFRHIGVVKDEYGVSSNGMKMFGVLDLEAGFEGLPLLNRNSQQP
jgi:hypothetical protein